MAPGHVAWHKREIARFVFRTSLFQRRGLTAAAAEALSETLVARDRDLDDRRHCIECAHLQEKGTCFAAAQGWMPLPRDFTPIKVLLQRCERFQFATP